ncbi:MAG: class I SAM-dependent methyltransferase [Pseudonocardiales bacterium]
MAPELRGRWNHNIHYYPLTLDALPRPCSRALDVGSGDGLLLRLLSPRCGHVVGIDSSAQMTEAARVRCADLANVQVVAGDAASYPFEPGSFDLVTSHATIHHLDFVPALERMAALLRPGGTLSVVSLANNATVADWLISAAGVPTHRVLALRHGYWQHNAPIADPTMTWREVRRAAEVTLPGVRWRRHLLWRYSLTWVKPAS